MTLRSSAVAAWFNNLDEHTVLMVFGAGVGAVSALGVVLFYKLIDLAFFVFFRIPSEHVSRAVFFAYRPVITGLGLICAYVVMHRVGRGQDGMNVPDVQVAVDRRGGWLPLRPALARTAASAVTMGSGGSAGSEGPVTVLGSTIGSWVARTFRLNSNQVKVLVGAGAAAGISAAFNAPLAGAFFALEEILNFGAAAFAPVVISSVVAAIVSRAFFGNHPAFPIPEEYGLRYSSELFLLYPLLGIICGLVAVLYIRVYFKVRDDAQRWQRHPIILAAAGGALVGMLVFISHGVLVGYGHLAVRLEVFGRMAWYSLALLALGKIVVTSLTLQTGGSGGVFTPSLYIGAATGGAFGVAVRQLIPGLTITPEAYALVGMGAVVAAATDAPITGILIVFEMTNDYAIMPALMLVVVIAAVLARKLEPDSLYSGYLRRRGELIRDEDRPDAWTSLRVESVVEDVTPVRLDASLDEILDRVAAGLNTDLPVTNQQAHVVGMIPLSAIAAAVRERDAAIIIVATDLAHRTEPLLPHDTLLTAIQRMGKRGVGTLPVIDAQSGELLGVVTRRHILAAYERAITNE